MRPRFRWTSRPNPRKTRLLSANWYRALTQFRSGVGGPCRGGCRGSGFRPVASFLSLSLSLARASPPVPWLGNWTRPLYPSLQYIYIYAFAKWLPTGHGSWRILRSTGVISLKDSRRFTDRCSLPHTCIQRIQKFLGFKREIERILFQEKRICVIQQLGSMEYWILFKHRLIFDRSIKAASYINFLAIKKKEGYLFCSISEINYNCVNNKRQVTRILLKILRSLLFLTL